MARDDELKGLIKQAMFVDGRLSSQPIDVGVLDGVVTLRGAVQTFHRKRAAGEVAASLGGVRDVVNQLEVRPPGVLSDEQVAENVRSALSAHADVTKESITVSVADGVVTLRGSAGSQWERALAEDVAIAARGVRGIYNLLVENQEQQRDEAHLAREIETALNLTAGLGDTGIRAAVAGNTAVLSGEVDALWQKTQAESVTRRFGLSRVRNDIQVRCAPP